MGGTSNGQCSCSPKQRSRVILKRSSTLDIFLHKELLASQRILVLQRNGGPNRPRKGNLKPRPPSKTLKQENSKARIKKKHRKKKTKDEGESEEVTLEDE